MAERVIDLCIGWGPWPGDTFLDLLRKHCAIRRLRCLVCRGENVRSVIRGVEAGRLRVLTCLDLEADFEDPDDLYARLCYAAKDSGAFLINEPDAAKAAQNKAVVHYNFVRAGIPVPYTVVVRNWEPADFRLTRRERTRLGRPFIIKPARGYGKQGVVRVDRGSVREIARARRYDRGDDFLLQQLVEPVWFGHRMGWFRVFYVLGEVIPCWWDTVTEHYESVTPEEVHTCRLAPLLQIARGIAESSGMTFFATEVAAVGSRSRPRFADIDYINHPCDLSVRSETHCGVPDAVVEHIAERLAEAAWRVGRGLDPVKPAGAWFGG